MHLITFGTDEHMLDTSSKQHERLLSYVPLVDSYTAIIFSKKTPWEVKTIGALTLIQLPKKGFFFNLYRTYTYLKKNKRNSKDTVISAQDPFEVGFVAWLFSVMLRYPLHLQIHSAVQSERARTESLRTRIQYALFMSLRNRARSIRVVSKSIKDFLVNRAGLSAEDIFVAPVVGDVPTEFKTEGYTGGTIQLLSVGRFVPVKNLISLLQAFSYIHKKYDTHLTLIGGGVLRQALVKTVQDLELTGNVSIKDWVNDIDAEYLQAHLYVHTAYHEGFGMTVVEALSRGVPVVVTPYGGSSEYVAPGVNGYVAEGFEAKDLEKSLEQAIAHLQDFDPTVVRNSFKMTTRAESSTIQLESWKHALKAR